MQNYLNIGCSPAAEECAQVGSENFAIRSRTECAIFLRQLRRVYGDEPEGAKLVIKSFPHDFGIYYEVVCYYDEDDLTAINYAFDCENLPEKWDKKAIDEMNDAKKMIGVGLKSSPEKLIRYNKQEYGYEVGGGE